MIVNRRSFGIGCLIALGTLASAFAQTTSVDAHGHCPAVVNEPGGGPHATAAAQNQAAQEFVATKLAVWRERLKLEDWRISAVMTRRSDLAPKTLGGISWDKGKRSAVIWVLDPSDYQLPFCEMLNDMELTVVHELVHLELATGRGTEEHAVNGIAEAMLGLDRKKE
jgi:hypothetical protein